MKFIIVKPSQLLRKEEGYQVKIVFKNMEPSQLVKNFAEDKIGPILNKFPFLKSHRTTLTIEMENSPHQSGRDLFTISSMITGQVFKGLRIKRSSENLYQATADLADGLNELLGQESDRLTKSLKKQKNFIGEYFYE